MFQCHICGNIEYFDNIIEKAFYIDAEIVIVNKIPSKVCTKCSEVSIS